MEYKIIDINSLSRKAWVENIVFKLTNTFNLKSPYDLCRELKISINHIDSRSPILCNKSSVYYRNYNGSEIIFVRNDLYGYDEEDILRHQLGHAILYPNMYNSSYHHSIKLDNEANYFGEVLKNVKLNIFRREFVDGL